MKTKIITLLLLLPLVAFTAFAQGSAENDALVQNLLLDAVSRLDTDPVRAKEAIEKIDRNYPANDAVKYYMGLIAYSAGDLASAEKYLSEAVRLDSCNIWYKDALAGLFAAQGRNHEAADLYIPLVEARPSYYANAYTLTLIGDRYLSLYRDSLARDCYDKALSLAPGYSPALLGRAELNRMTGAGLDPSLLDMENLNKSEGGDNLNLIFKVLKRGEKLDEALESKDPDALCDMGLRYDLTLPLARFYAANREALPRVFKVIQTDRVYRAERPQKGRFREFVQCDIDILGDSSPNAEVELIDVTARALLAIGFTGFTVQVNDRRILRGMLSAMGFAPDL